MPMPRGEPQGIGVLLTGRCIDQRRPKRSHIKRY
jgi:hypothetical protein